MASSRFPGKPLARILGHTMLEHVYRRTRLCAALAEVLIATCDEEIRVAAEAFGAPIVMTSSRHERAAERAAEVAAKVEADVVVLVQGDEPMVRPEMLDDLVAPLRADPTLRCTNLMLAIDEADARDQDQVKVVCDLAWNALYMSREPLPTFRYDARGPRWRQLGLIAFRRDFLLELMALPPTPLERAESVDMLRALEHGFPVRMVPTRHVTYAVDTPADVPRVEALLKGDELLSRYTVARRA
jgi:3-deoxy-manno-octulosonate cytidylyltransferase (CMP-KDO synthetase)